MTRNSARRTICNVGDLRRLKRLLALAASWLLHDGLHQDSRTNTFVSFNQPRDSCRRQPKALGAQVSLTAQPSTG
jgi:hypothetical protein